MAKYNLSYSMNGVINDIDLSGIDLLEGKKITELKTIDFFTSHFTNIDALLYYLKSKGIINHNVTSIYITKEKKDKDSGKVLSKKIFNGDVLMFSLDKVYTDTNYLRTFVGKNSRNADFIVKLSHNYYKKYSSISSLYLLNLLADIMSVADVLKSRGFANLSNSEIYEYENSLDKFLLLELYRKKGDTYIEDYPSIRNFGVFIKRFIKDNTVSIDDEFQVDNQESLVNVVLKENNDDTEHEEFLTDEDFIWANEQILSTYKENKDLVVSDSHDGPKSLSKLELKKALNDIRDQLVTDKTTRRR